MKAPDRAALLEELWERHAELLLAQLRATAPDDLTAAMAREVRQFLSDSGITHEAMPGGRRGGGPLPLTPEQMSQNLPSPADFDDDDDDPELEQ